MYFSPYHYRKDPLNLQSIVNEGNETVNLSPEKQKLKELAQMERRNKANSFDLENEKQANFQLRQIIAESIKRGIFPLSLNDAKQIESEISMVLNDINRKLQISDLSIFVMTKYVCYKFYLLYHYNESKPKFIVPAAFLLSAKLVCKTYHQSNCKHIFHKLVHLKFVESNDSLVQSEQIIIKTLNSQMAYLEDPVKIIGQLCQEKNLENNIQQKAYKIVSTLEPIKFQTWLPKDIANNAIDVAIANQNINTSKESTDAKTSVKDCQNNTTTNKLTEFTNETKNDLHIDKAHSKAKLQNYPTKEDISKAYENFDKPYICKICSGNFGENLEKFLKHYSICSEKVSKITQTKPPYKCGICKKNFGKYKSQCAQHQIKCEIKHRKCKFKCDCGSLFATKFTLERHKSSIHKN